MDIYNSMVAIINNPKNKEKYYTTHNDIVYSVSSFGSMLLNQYVISPSSLLSECENFIQKYGNNS